MTNLVIRNRIAECCTLFGFTYNGLQCDVDPFNEHKFNLFCNGTQKTVNSIDAVMNDPFFDGKSLNEIAEEIDIDSF